MKVYAGTGTHLPFADVEAHVRRVEALGYDGIKVPETVNDGMITAALVAEHSERLRIVTAIILAFPRSPMQLAYSAWGVQQLAGGRLNLGLGTQVKGNIEGRYGVPWTPPIGRMREYLQAMQAIFAAFQSGEGVRYEGEQYRITRLQPRFNPGPIDCPPPSLWLGAVNPAICRLAGELADGVLTHPTNSSPRYLREVTLANIAEGAKRTGRDPSEVELIPSLQLLTGATQAEIDRQREVVRESMGFWYSTPPSWPTLQIHGFTELGPRLRELTRAGKWDEMSSLISDELIDALMPEGAYDRIADVILEWYGDIVDGVTFPLPQDPARDEQVGRVIEQLQAA